MQHFRSIDEIQLENAWLTIGSFDGVHLGHQVILKQLIAGAHAVGAQAVVLTFDPHPSVVLGKRNGAFYLTTPEQRAALMGEMGIDAVITQTFTLEFAALSAHQFMLMASQHLGLRQLWVGYDFALGHGREGNIDRLRELGNELGYELHVIPAVEVDGMLVSSSKVRSLIFEGNLDEATRLLGRPYRLAGTVVSGDGRGRMIGIPTANLDIPAEMALPKSGVYVCQARLSELPGKIIGAVTNIGLRPTFEHGPVAPRVEAHLLDFVGDLYGQRMDLDILHRLRDEVRFATVDALIEQIHVDIALARSALMDSGRVPEGSQTHSGTKGE